MLPTPISTVRVDGREFLIKRDDLIDPLLSGNKYRKLYTLLQTPSCALDRVISYGGTQSNAMLSIAKVCHDKKWEFIYYTKPLSKTQKSHPSGNYAHAIELGMQHVEIEYDLYKDFIASLTLQENSRTLLLHQGGAMQTARKGIEQLAKEIQEQLNDVKALATPSGTGTTALFLARALPEYRIYTTSCVGDSVYLQKQMRAIAPLPSNLTILQSEKKYAFGKPYKEFWQIYTKLKEQTAIEFDLLYAPLMWKMIIEQTDETLCYIHSGGVLGNESMLERYKLITPPANYLNYREGKKG